MKKTICKLIHIFLLGAFVFCPALALAHGGGGGGGGGGGDAASEAFNSDSNSGDSYLMGGGVTWNPNPNDRDGMRGSIYDGRDANIEKGPYKPGEAVEVAEALLLAGYTAGNYTSKELQDQLNWAVSVGIKISLAAQNILDQINDSKPSSSENNLTKKKKDDSKSSSTKNDSKDKREKDWARVRFIDQMLAMDPKKEYAKERKDSNKELEESFLMWIFFGAFRDLY